MLSSDGRLLLIFANGASTEVIQVNELLSEVTPNMVFIGVLYRGSDSYCAPFVEKLSKGKGSQLAIDAD